MWAVLSVHAGRSGTLGAAPRFHMSVPLTLVGLGASIRGVWARAVDSWLRDPDALALAPLGGALAAPEDGVWSGLLLAAPKKKVSHSRKAMRAANKGLKDRVNLVHCPACSRPKLQHHLCEHCYGDLARSLKQRS
ncbi:hypothetical protein MVES1_003350 [Malassezia vespertilionis]|uniref:Large ribosomal subunit protein bL32m n=1 Tax=Malassezia vespertilionis TaxID=2020962 RepID=A0A2N1J757_9BASI|nr:uncharacterized protein MVES1_003350 [Malassezia vespertilionis]PKI82381.1 hypothetical protein MVES_003593 [Malassezia vespertilionis]WFD07981.1 hypothetical protein MVES1_003350 [Malassezia vespertilionis]